MGRSAPCLSARRVAGAFGGGAGRRGLGRGLDRGVADGVLGLDGVAQAGGAALHHAAQRVPAVAAGARLGRRCGWRAQARARALITPSARVTAGSRSWNSSSRTKTATGASSLTSARSSVWRASRTRRRRWVSGGSARQSMLAATKARNSSRSSRRSTSCSSPPSGRAAARGGRPAARRLAILQPVLRAGALPRATPAADQRRHQVGRLGRHGAGEGEGHGKGIEEFDPECKKMRRR